MPFRSRRLTAALAGLLLTTPAHADLAASIIRLLGNTLLGQCRVSSSDLKVRIAARLDEIAAESAA